MDKRWKTPDDHLYNDAPDGDWIGQRHSVHGQRERPPADGVLHKQPQHAVSQKFHHAEVASQQPVDVVGWQEARHRLAPPTCCPQLPHLEAHRALKKPRRRQRRLVGLRKKSVTAGLVSAQLEPDAVGTYFDRKENTDSCWCELKDRLAEHQRLLTRVNAGHTCRRRRLAIDRLSCCNAASRPLVRRPKWRSMLPKPPNESGLALALASPICSNNNFDS